MDSMRKLMYFFISKAGKPILEITQPCCKLLFCIIFYKSFTYYRSATVALFDTTGQLII